MPEEHLPKKKKTVRIILAVQMLLKVKEFIFYFYLKKKESSKNLKQNGDVHSQHIQLQRVPNHTAQFLLYLSPISFLFSSENSNLVASLIFKLC